MEQLIYSKGVLYLREPSEKVLSTIEYTVVERSIQNFQQYKEDVQYILSVSPTEVTSYTHKFQLHALLDVSYKPFTNGQGFLYLHTNQGVFSFLVSTNPESFMQVCRKLVGS